MKKTENADKRAGVPTAKAENDAKRAHVLAAVARLEDRHVAWMVEALRAHFRTYVEKAEMEIARHLACSADPLVPHALERNDPPRREALVAESRTWLAQYRTIQIFIEDLGDFVTHARAAKAGEELAALFRQGRRARNHRAAAKSKLSTEDRNDDA